MFDVGLGFDLLFWFAIVEPAEPESILGSTRVEPEPDEKPMD